MFPIFAATSNNVEGLIRRSRKDQVSLTTGVEKTRGKKPSSPSVEAG